MTVVDTLAFPAPTTPGSELVAQLPNKMGTEREDALYAMYMAGQCPMWLRQWHEIEVEHEGLTGAFYVLPDFMCVGTDSDYIYTPMGALNAERVLTRFKAVLPTQKMVETIYSRSVKQVAQPWDEPYDSSMMYTSRWPTQTSKVRRMMGETGVILGQLVEGHYKNVIVSDKVMKNHGVDLGFFGWYQSNGKPIQGDSLAHGACYCDYSHGVRGVLNKVVVGDVFMSLEEALDHEEAYKLFSHVRFHPGTYAAARSLQQAATGEPLPLKY